MKVKIFTHYGTPFAITQKMADQLQDNSMVYQKTQVTGGLKSALSALIREYLFVSLFNPCAESLACENASHLNTMQRAKKNISELLYILNHRYHSLRQSSIDEELFDIFLGFEALKNKR